MVMALVSSKEADSRPCPLLLTSVMHSGTRFFQEAIKPSHVNHLHQDTAIGKVIGRAGVVACAIRKPELVLRSWYKRRTGRINTFGDPSVAWEKSWHGLRDFSRQYADKWFFLPIDHCDRQIWLDRLADRLGREIAPDWDNVVGASGGSASIPRRIKVDWIYEIPIVRELYGA